MFRRSFTAAAAVALTAASLVSCSAVSEPADTQKLADSVDWDVPGQIKDSAASELTPQEAMNVYTAYSQAMLEGDVEKAKHYGDEEGILEHNGPDAKGSAYGTIDNLQDYSNLLRSASQYFGTSSLSNPRPEYVTDAPGGKFFLVSYGQRSFDHMGDTIEETCQRSYFLKFIPSPEYPQAGHYAVSGVHDILTCEPGTINSMP